MIATYTCLEKSVAPLQSGLFAAGTRHCVALRYYEVTSPVRISGASDLALDAAA